VTAFATEVGSSGSLHLNETVLTESFTGGLPASFDIEIFGVKVSESAVSSTVASSAADVTGVDETAADNSVAAGVAVHAVTIKITGNTEMTLMSFFLFIIFILLLFFKKFINLFYLNATGLPPKVCPV
jgi:hypothetical protein